MVKRLRFCVKDDWPAPGVWCSLQWPSSGVLGTCWMPRTGLLVLVLDQRKTQLALGGGQLWVMWAEQREAMGSGRDYGKSEHLPHSEGEAAQLLGIDAGPI